MAFEIGPQVEVRRDADGTVRKLRHPRQAFRPQAAEEGFAAAAVEDEATPRQLADQYLREVLPIYGLELPLSDGPAASLGVAAAGERPALRFDDEKAAARQAVVSYAQTELGLPVWRSGMTVKMVGPPYRVVSSQSTVDAGVRVEPPAADAAYRPEALDEPTLARLLGLADGRAPRINEVRQLVYRYEPGDRGNGVGVPQPTDPSQGHVAHPTLSPPPPDARLEGGRHYVVAEVLFTLADPAWGDVHWGAFVEQETGSVLRLESFVGCVEGLVYRRDPLTRTGNPALRPSSPPATLDLHRERVVLDGLVAPAAPSTRQELRGAFVALREVQAPEVRAPFVDVGGHFEFSVPSDDFAAVNAYYHCDRLFRLLEGMGFDVASYFDGTRFPVPVDHRVSYNGDPESVNASAPGNALRSGSDGFRFARLAHGTTIGMAAEWRVVLHEFGHAVLWDHVHWPNFPFAHSAGDSLAAILNDPGSRAPDRFDTFPWTPIRRRHDRRVEDGWGWGGRFDDPFPVGDGRSADRAGYDREQILSSTLFRLYRALGGDHTDEAVQTQAARYTAYLIFASVGTLMPETPPATAEDYADELIDADLAAGEFEGMPGGVAQKAIRWAFERQGAYQPPDAPLPVRAPGAPPAVDVYVDDGRGGGYAPRNHFVFTSDQVWHRREADGGTTHQEPVAGRPGFLYTRVANRGTEPARNVRLRAFATAESGERRWPDAWNELGVATLAALAGAGGEAVLGPIAWTPAAPGGVTVLVSVAADGDPSNADLLAGLSAALLAHTDNNVAGRPMRVADAAGGEGGEGGEVTPLHGQVQPRLAVPDADPAGVVSEIVLPSAAGAMARVRVEVTIAHTYRGDLAVSLESPRGSSAVLFEGELGDAAHDLSATFTSAELPALAALHGEDPAGSWRLRVVDRVGADVGTLERWSLTVETA